MKIAHFSVLILAILPLAAQEGGIESNRQLRVSVQKWIAIMKEVQAKKKEWKEEKQILSDLKVSLEAESQQLQLEIEAAGKRRKKIDADSSEKLEQKETYDAAREALREGLNGLESKVSAVIPLLPKELASQDKVAKAISDHQSFVAKTDKESLQLNKRLTPMVTILVEAEKFNQVITPFEGRTVEVGGQPLILDGIYFGLAMGFAADEAGTKAISLKPGPGGWTETEITDPETVGQIRELIDVGKGAGEVMLVDLPLEIAQ